PLTRVECRHLSDHQQLGAFKRSDRGSRLTLDTPGSAKILLGKDVGELLPSKDDEPVAVEQGGGKHICHAATVLRAILPAAGQLVFKIGHRYTRLRAVIALELGSTDARPLAGTDLGCSGLAKQEHPNT